MFNIEVVIIDSGALGKEIKVHHSVRQHYFLVIILR